MEIWESKPPGTLWATPGLLRNSFTFTYLVLYVHECMHVYTETVTFTNRSETHLQVG